jgi:outer membrane protein TolC
MRRQARPAHRRRWAAARVLPALGLLVALGLASPVPAVEAPPAIDPAALTLEEALTLARVHAPALHEARAKVALARLDVQATRWWTWLIPAVTVTPGYDLLAGQERAAAALSLDLSRFLGSGARDAERARLGLTQAERAVAVAAQEVEAAVTTAVFRLATARATASLREAAVADALKLHALETVRFDLGTGDLAPLLRAREALGRTRLDLLAAQQETALAALALRRAIGLPAPAP